MSEYMKHKTGVTLQTEHFRNYMRELIEPYSDKK